MLARFYGCLPKDVWPMTDRSMSLVELDRALPHAELRARVGAKRDTQGVKAPLLFRLLASERLRGTLPIGFIELGAKGGSV